jgi:ABC-type transport system substrate-binding protein
MNSFRKAALSVGLVGATLAGGALGATLVGSASAQTTTTPAATATQPAATPAPGSPAPGTPRDPSKGGHMANGITETLLTGDTAAKVKAAALAAVPGGTVERVENDAEGSPYEAHMTKADGTHVTVKVGSDFKVTTIETGR